ncbi:DUF4397 domain-containing protein [Alkalihalophilus pseudofirmus]|uniref:DUF4397 domain-containing protein n=1 Tax=Alkalihalophilus pseudofirmus TaxID=79885 RepID=UPI00259B4561|nr:DUF4397 domain-containing protein [Alkalihalophilus pseudofirmus]WEG17881.1 DUF4397 domain-containing protein [Alkalihalophilus pseudofirmus]
MKKLLSLVLLFMLFLTLTGTGFAEEMAMVRVLHATPDAPGVDVFVNEELVVENIEFKDASDYLQLPAGSHKVEIYAAGDTTSAIISEQLAVSGGEAYTVSAIGQLESIRLTTMLDEQEVSEGNTKIRVAHFSPDAPAVDIATDTGDILFPNAAFSAVTDYLELPAGEYNLEIRAAGTADVVEELTNLELKEGMIYTAVATGLLNAEPEFDVILLTDAMPTPEDMPKTGLGGASDIR